MARVIAVLFCALLMAVLCTAQVNFSPNWGKRAASSEGCKASMDSIMYLYKLIQNEAQKIVDCEKFSN
ncbi:hypothetical protein LSTR_LSTR016254 [Laodelphax striatellus]|uniref:Adipokinetic hormone 1 n=2 Tax=Laodelphax striatellus TaxID=195883 RepID=A0A482WYQ5_LAOST|nr:hypothetical protein LSTR_LSTR016254 [Laodelphax striatellus]